MPLVEMFRASAFVGLTVCVCLLAIFWCIVLLPRLGRGHERFLVGFIGLTAVYQGLRTLKDAGLWRPPGSPSLEHAATLVVCALYLVALLVVQVFGAEHRQTKVRLRMAEANEAPPPSGWRARRAVHRPAGVHPESPVVKAGEAVHCESR
jgi:hypothetical protein